MTDFMKISDFRALPKSDLHNHCLLGGKRSVIEKHLGRKLSTFKAEQTGIGDLNRWIEREFRPFFQLPDAFEKAVEAAFIQAKFDGITRLEMSIDVLFGTIFNVSAGRIVDVLKKYHHSVAPEIDFCPELGFPRNRSLRTLLAGFEPFPDFQYFQSIDLYDDEFAQPIANFKELYRYAKKLGMKCKAHAGEFGSAESVKEAVEMLELDAVQHGIGAAGSPAVMRWLADHKIPLNVCPTSNIKLKRVRSYKTHPIRILFDHGVKVTINTDDALVFGDGVSEQYLQLLRHGVFTMDELEVIRRNGQPLS
ncbi:MAG: adenosine deaminase [Bacteroidetes bacterium]|nr:adenosine deaminase [Bacteroidota bacterium]